MIILNLADSKNPKIQGIFELKNSLMNVTLAKDSITLRFIEIFL